MFGITAFNCVSQKCVTFRKYNKTTWFKLCNWNINWDRIYPQEKIFEQFNNISKVQEKCLTYLGKVVQVF